MINTNHGHALCIDPGVHSVGYCIVSQDDTGWRMTGCGVYKFSDLSELASWASIQRLKYVVCEVPQIYQGRSERKDIDQNDLINLALTAGAVLSSAPGNLAVRIHPRDWKNNQSKTDHQRSKIIPRLSRQTLDDLGKIKNQKLKRDAIDAAGIGLWFIDRWNEGLERDAR